MQSPAGGDGGRTELEMEETMEQGTNSQYKIILKLIFGSISLHLLSVGIPYYGIQDNFQDIFKITFSCCIAPTGLRCGKHGRGAAASDGAMGGEVQGGDSTEFFESIHQDIFLAYLQDGPGLGLLEFL